MTSDYREGETPDEAREGTALTAPRGELSDAGRASMQGPSDADVSQEDRAVEALRHNRDIQPETWQGLDEAERLNALQNVENQMAALQNRPPAEVDVYDGRPGECGQYSPDTNQIHINEGHLMGDPVCDVVDTTVHEGRHAYQHHAVDHPGVHDDSVKVEAWRENMQPGNYLTAEQYGQKRYQEQPVEKDAWAYGRRIADGVYG